MTRRHTKATRTALQLDLPEADHVIAAVDRACMPGVRVLRPAHVSLAYPWLPPVEAFARLDQLERTVATTPAVTLRLGALQAFAPDGRGRRLLHLTVEPALPVQKLAAAVADQAIRPHLSLARVAAGHDERPVYDLVQPLLPIWALARTVQFRVQYGQWWRIERVFHLAPEPPLGSGPAR